MSRAGDARFDPSFYFAYFLSVRFHLTKKFSTSSSTIINS